MNQCKLLTVNWRPPGYHSHYYCLSEPPHVLPSNSGLISSIAGRRFSPVEDRREEKWIWFRIRLLNNLIVREYKVLSKGSEPVRKIILASYAVSAEGMVKRSKWGDESVEEVLGWRGGAAITVGHGTDRVERRSEEWALVVSRYT